ncbi:hypothetical protein [Staphylococcus capitis]|uniref:hypothetical protein n=1 Tax=Staphylococcus capitis TaxID=29388 RepID=UPI00119E4317|nr:hypothetical protein [Staphylococcus capitis]
MIVKKVCVIGRSVISGGVLFRTGNVCEGKGDEVSGNNGKEVGEEGMKKRGGNGNLEHLNAVKDKGEQ